MKDLDAYRREIDAIDRKIVALFEQRMSVTEQVGRYKQEKGLPVLDANREREVLAKKRELVTKPELETDVTLLYENIMGISRRQQRRVVYEGESNPSYAKILRDLAQARTPVKDPLVYYQGVPGAYSEMAAIDFFGPDVRTEGVLQFEDVFLAVKEGKADYGLLPIENSSTGAIRQIYDLLQEYDFHMVGETTVKVDHCLMALPGATLDTIESVYSHEQGLFQCERYLNAHPNWKQIPHEDTAGSARMVAESGDLTRAAVCSSRAAELYGLEILAKNIITISNNTTRFVVVSPRMELREGSNKISTCFKLPHQSGSLHEILTVFAVHGLNMVRLESRPIPGRSWEYMFFLEFTGNIGEERMEGIFHELTQTTEEFRVLGNFAANLE